MKIAVLFLSIALIGCAEPRIHNYESSSTVFYTDKVVYNENSPHTEETSRGTVMKYGN